jgi:hypothetical protein
LFYSYFALTAYSDTSTSPNNGLLELQTDELAVANKRRATINVSSYPVSPSLDGLQIPDLPMADPTIINSKYAYETKPVSPPSRSLDKPGFHYDRQSQKLSPHRPPSSYGPSPQNSPELTSADTFRYSLSPRSSPVPPPSSRLPSAPSPQGSCSELILPQPALDYVVANM